jgi:cytochrome c oxidase subunit 3/cytochrome o ubiquinol oxidase subunit 3
MADKSELIAAMDKPFEEPSRPTEEIHLPPPSYMPLLLGLGFFVFVFGLIAKSDRVNFLAEASRWWANNVQSLAAIIPSLWVIVAFLGLVILFAAIGGWVMSNIAERTHAPHAFQGDSKMAMWVFLGNEVLFFTGLIASFLLLRSLSEPGVDHALVNSIPLVSINTFILLTSSLTVVLAHDAAIRNQQGKLKLMLFLTIILGTVFVSLQGVEYSTLYSEGLTWTSSGFGTAFFTLTGTHGLHVIIGIIWCIIVLIGAFTGNFKGGRYGGVEIFGLYWHFVDVVWILLFTIVYLMHTPEPHVAEPAALVLKLFGL